MKKEAKRSEMKLKKGEQEGSSVTLLGWKLLCYKGIFLFTVFVS